MRLGDWFDNRTGYRKLMHTLLHEPIPGGARWNFVWGSTLVFVFALQVLTGLLLMTVYSPSATTAWSSVWYIQTQLPLGWLIRGLHHFGSQAMIILIPIHILQVVFAKAYRAPREVNWWFGLGLLAMTLGLSLTGYLLPWDQKGYWATKVATNIMGLTPLIGCGLQKLVVGGSEYGHLTLARFFTLHVMLLPGAFILFLIAHLALFRRHGVTVVVRDSDLEDGHFWPDQFLKDSIACLVVLVGMVIAVGIKHFVFHDELLDAPADPAASDYPARPEWYYLFLFELLKHFEGPKMEVIGAIVVPAAAGLALFLVPLLDKVLWRWLAHALAITITVGLLGGAGYLTYKAVRADRDPPAAVVATVEQMQRDGKKLSGQNLTIMRAHQFNAQRREATRVAHRVLELAAAQGIPPSGPLELVANDPLIRGPQLFATPGNCTSCHRFDDHDGRGKHPAEPPTAADLAGFGSRKWIRGLLENPMDPRYFGLAKTKEGEPAHTRMAKWLEDILSENESPQDRKKLLEYFDAVAAYLEDESIRPGRLASMTAETAPASQPATRPAAMETAASDPQELLIRRGRIFFMSTCNECHSYQGERSGTTKAPEMFGYGSVDWIEQIIADPTRASLYRGSGRGSAQMPPFKDKLTQRERRLIAQWLHDSRSTMLTSP